MIQGDYINIQRKIKGTNINPSLGVCLQKSNADSGYLEEIEIRQRPTQLITFYSTGGFCVTL